MRVVLLAIVGALIACSERVDLPWDPGADFRGPVPVDFPLPTPTVGPPYRPPIRTWHSFDVSIASRSVLDTAGTLGARVDLFESDGSPATNAGDFDVLAAAASYPEPLDEVGDFRVETPGTFLPHVAKNAVARAELGAPSPSGVFDLQFFPPPQSGSFATAGFVVPTAGTYTITALAYRKVRAGGDAAFFRIYDENEQQLDATSTNIAAWTTHSDIAVGVLSSGDRIYFSIGPGPGGNNTADAVEVTFSIRREP